MNKIIGVPLGYIMYLCYIIFKNYGVALILFTVFTKVILFPMAVKQQKNTAHMASVSPKLEKIKKKYGNNKEKIQEETMKIYSEEGVNPMASCLPLLIQMPILFGLYYVVYAPLTYILRFSEATITAAKNIIYDNPVVFKTILDNSNFKNRPELYLLDAVKDNPASFSALGSDFVNKVSNFDYSFFGLALGKNPSITHIDILILIPILSFLTNLLLTIYTQKMTKKHNPAAQQVAGMNTVMYIMPVMSAMFAFQFPAGVGVYWIISSVLSLLQVMLLYKIYTPEKVAISMKKKNANRKKKKPGLYERAMQAQKAQTNGGSVSSSSTTSIDENGDIVESEDEKLSKSAVKDLQRKKLAEARKRMAEKYGDTYDEGND